MSERKSRPGIISAILSVIAAFFGVQSESNRQRDFQHGNPLIYIVIGVVLAVIMVLGLVSIVNWVLAASPS